ncbi:hypothetical protein THAOC_09421, partial [Thalassiosira oceanica]
TCTLDREVFFKELSKLDHDMAPGLGGLQNEHLTAREVTPGAASAADDLYAFADNVVQCRLPLLRGASLTRAYFDAGILATINEIVAPVQNGAGLKGGISLSVLGVQASLKARPDFCAIQGDLKNGYNEVKRESILASVREYPDLHDTLVYLFRLLEPRSYVGMGSGTNVSTAPFRIEEGVQQGAVESLYAFSLSVNKPYKRAKARLAEGGGGITAITSTRPAAPGNPRPRRARHGPRTTSLRNYGLQHSGRVSWVYRDLPRRKQARLINDNDMIKALLDPRRWTQPEIPTHQLAFLMLRNCLQFRGDYWLRHLPPQMTEAFAEALNKSTSSTPSATRSHVGPNLARDASRCRCDATGAVSAHVHDGGRCSMLATLPKAHRSLWIGQTTTAIRDRRYVRSCEKSCPPGCDQNRVPPRRHAAGLGHACPHNASGDDGTLLVAKGGKMPTSSYDRWAFECCDKFSQQVVLAAPNAMRHLNHEEFVLAITRYWALLWQERRSGRRFCVELVLRASLPGGGFRVLHDQGARSLHETVHRLDSTGAGGKTENTRTEPSWPPSWRGTALLPTKLPTSAALAAERTSWARSRLSSQEKAHTEKATARQIRPPTNVPPTSDGTTVSGLSTWIVPCTRGRWGRHKWSGGTVGPFEEALGQFHTGNIFPIVAGAFGEANEDASKLVTNLARLTAKTDFGKSMSPLVSYSRKGGAFPIMQPSAREAYQTAEDNHSKHRSRPQASMSGYARWWQNFIPEGYGLGRGACGGSAAAARICPCLRAALDLSFGAALGRKVLESPRSREGRRRPVAVDGAEERRHTHKGSPPFSGPWGPSPLAGWPSSGPLHKTQRRPTEPKKRRRGRALQTEDFQQAETANPVPPSSRTPIGSVKNEWIWAEESNSRRGKPRSKR